MDSAIHHDAGGYSSDLVSVIIPAYNTARFIRETLDSVLAQTYPHFEVIVVNDGSPDTRELEDVLCPYMHRVNYIKQDNRGLAGARNTGLRAAKGTLVALLDSDDVWLPDYLAEQVNFLHQHREFDLVYCNARFFGDSVYAGKEYMEVCPSEGVVDAKAILDHRCHIFVSITARINALRAVKFDEDLRSSEDFDCWIRFVAKGFRIGYHRRVLCLYRKHEASLSANPIWMAESKIKALTKSLDLWPADSPEHKLLLKTMNRTLAELETIRGRSALHQQNFPAAVTHFSAANAYLSTPKMSMVIALLKLAPRLVSAIYGVRARTFAQYRDIAQTRR